MSSRFSNAGSEAPAATARFAVFVAGTVSFLNMYCTMAVLPLLAAGFSESRAATGLTVTAPLLATALMAPLTGAISDRLGRKTLILGAALLLILPTLLAADARSLFMLVVWRFAQGLTLPFIFTVTIAYLGDEFAGAAAVRLAAIYMSGSIFGGFAGRAMSGLVAQVAGWRAAMVLVAVVTLGLAAVIAVWLPRERRFVPVRGFRRSLRGFALHLRNKRLLANNLVGFGVLFCMIGTFTYVNFRLAGAPYRLGPAALGLVFGVYLAAAVVNPLAARLANRIGHAGVMALAAPAAVAGLALTLAPALPVIIAGLLIICCAVFSQQTLATSFIGLAAREARSVAVGLYVTSYYVGGAVGGLVPALPYRLFGWPGAVAVLMAVQLAMFWLGWRAWRKR